MYLMLARINNHTPITTLIHGAAKGADVMAGDWASSFGIPVEEYSADWDAYGKAAGPVRNQQMLTEGKPDVVLAFPTVDLSTSKGTRSMVTKAIVARVRTYTVDGDTLYTHDGHVVPLGTL